MQKFGFVVSLFISIVVSSLCCHAGEPDALGRDLPGEWIGNGKPDALFISTQHDVPGTAFLWKAENSIHVSGSVGDESTGKKLPNASLRFSASFAGVPVKINARTDASGFYEIDLPLHPTLGGFRWSVLATRDDAAGVRSVILDADTGSVDVLVHPGRRLSVRAYESETKKPIPEFKVLYRDSRLEESHDGVCNLYIPEPQRIGWFVVIAENRAWTRWDVDMSGEKDHVLTLPIVKGLQIHGKVVNKDNNGVPLNPISLTGFSRARALTNPQGEFVMHGARFDQVCNVHACSYLFGDLPWWSLASAPYVAESKANPADRLGTEANPIQFVVTPELSVPQKISDVPKPDAITDRVIRGVVLNPNRTPSKQFSIRVPRSGKNPEIMYLYNEHGYGAQFGNNDGTFEIANLDFDKPVSLIVSAEGFADAECTAEPISKRLFTNADQLEVVLQEPSPLQFDVIDDGNDPVPNVRIRVTRAKVIATALLNSGFEELEYVKSGLTDATGKLTFDRSEIHNGTVVVDGSATALQTFPFDDSINTIRLAESHQMTVHFQCKEAWQSDLMVEIKTPILAGNEQVVFAKRLTGTDRRIQVPLLEKAYTLNVYAWNHSDPNHTDRYVFAETGTGKRTLEYEPNSDGSKDSETTFDLERVDP